MNLTARTAPEALRMAKAAEAAKAGDFDVWPNGDGTATLDSWKTVDGKRTYDRYEVDLNKVTCTCPSFVKEGRFCKHIIYLDELARLEEEEAFIQDMIDGQAFMENLHTERSIGF